METSPPVWVLVQVPVKDLDHFWSVFTTRGLEARKGHGCQGARVFHSAEDRNQVTILFQWESKEALDGFRNDPMVKETMQSSGIAAPPSFTLLVPKGELPH